MCSLIHARKIIQRFALIISVVWFAGPARAEINVGESVDWLVLARPHIAIAEVISTDPHNKTEAKWTDLTINIRLKKRLKGQPPQSAEFVRLWQMSARPGEEDNGRPENGTEYLVFFDELGKITNAMNLTLPSHKRGVGADDRDVALSTNFDILNTK